MLHFLWCGLPCGVRACAFVGGMEIQNVTDRAHGRGTGVTSSFERADTKFTVEHRDTPWVRVGTSREGHRAPCRVAASD